MQSTYNEQFEALKPSLKASMETNNTKNFSCTINNEYYIMESVDDTFVFGIATTEDGKSKVKDIFKNIGY